MLAARVVGVAAQPCRLRPMAQQAVRAGKVAVAVAAVAVAAIRALAARVASVVMAIAL